MTNLGANEAQSSPSAAQRAVANFSGASSINLRGIGVEATLTLMDGQRLLSEGGEGRYFDPNSLPLLSVERIEIVPDGASAAYGSDAIAGVVNIIPGTKFNGEEVQARYGGAAGLNQYQANAIVGNTWDGGNVVIAYEFNQRSNLAASARPDQYVNSPIYGATSNSTYPINLVNNSGPPPYPFTGAGPYQFKDVAGTGTLNAANLTATAAGGAGSAGNWVGVDALPEQTRNSAYVYIDQQLNSKVKIYAQGFVTERDFLRHGGAQGESNLTIPGQASGATANAYNDIAATAAGDYSFLSALGPEIASGYERAGQARLGARIELGGDWVGEVYGSAGQTNDYIKTINQVNSQALGAAASCVNPAQPNGPFGFPAGSVSTCNNTATAFDPFSNLQPGTPGFGYPNAATYQSVLNSITGYSFTNATLNQGDINLKADGSFADLPGGRARLAVGVDLQYIERSNATGGNLSGASNTQVNVVNDPGFDRSIDSAYVELYAPLVGDNNALPGVHSLSLSAAVRYDRYNDQQDSVVGVAGFNHTYDTENPKIGLTWQPAQDLVVRASYGTSFRAPVPGDYAYGAPTLGIPFFITPAVATALGIPACGGTANCDMIEVQGGQADLKPETAQTYSVGFDYRPSKIPGLDVSLTYYNINYTNQIVVPGTGNWESDVAYALALKGAGFLTPNPTQGAFGAFNNTIDGYLSYGNANAVNPSQRYTPYDGLPGYLFANHIVSPSLLVNALNVNSGDLQTDGLDYVVRYVWKTSLGSFVVADTGTIVLSDLVSLVPGAPKVSYLNQINNLMHFQTRGQMGWNNESWSVNGFLNYVNAYQNPGVDTVGAYTTVDMTVSYSPSRSLSPWLSNTKVSVDVQNLFDAAEEPRFFLAPREDIEVVDDWFTAGMRGTGSRSIRIADAFIPHHRSVSVAQMQSGESPGVALNPGPLYRHGFSYVTPFSIVGAPIGMARGAVRSTIANMAPKLAGAGVDQISEQSPAIIDLAATASEIDAAYAMVLADAEQVDRANGLKDISPADQIRIPHNWAWGVQTARRAANKLFENGGGNGIYSKSDLQRYWRDVNAAAQHKAFGWAPAMGDFGRVLLGLPAAGYKLKGG